MLICLVTVFFLLIGTIIFSLFGGTFFTPKAQAANSVSPLLGKLMDEIVGDFTEYGQKKG